MATIEIRRDQDALPEWNDANRTTRPVDTYSTARVVSPRATRNQPRRRVELVATIGSTRFGRADRSGTTTGDHCLP